MRAIWPEWPFAAAVSAEERRKPPSPRATRYPLICASSAVWSCVTGAVLPLGVAEPAEGAMATARPTASVARTVFLRIPSRSAAAGAENILEKEYLDLKCRGRALVSVLEPVEEHDLERAGDGDRRERADDPRELRADQDRDEHRERGELHRPAIDDRLQQVVLDLLIDDEEDHHHDPGGYGVQERDGADQDRRDRRGGEGDQVEDRHDKPEGDGVGQAPDKQMEHRQGAGDQADQQVAGDVPADGAVDLVADVPPARLRARG